MKSKILILIASFIVFTMPFVSAEIANFYESLDTSSSISANGGSISGSLSFVPGVNNNAAYFNGASSIHYTNSVFNSPNGSISFWFKKDSSSTKGGLLQIGTLGSANSIGLFYNAGEIYFEIRKNAGASGGVDYVSVHSPQALSDTEYKHILVTWEKRSTGYSMKFFVNGLFVVGTTYSQFPTFSSGFMDLGYTYYYNNAKGNIDELRFFNRQLSDPEIYGEYVYSSNKFRKQAVNKPISTGPVKIINSSLYVNGQPFIVKGVGYEPTPVGSMYTNTIYSNTAILNRDMPLLRAMGANTVRLWQNLPDKTTLDYLYNNGANPIYAIVSFQISTALNYSNPTTITNIENQFRTYVNTYKNHPAVLAWAIGNENNLHYPYNKADWYILANKLAKVAYEAEGASYHPTMVINGYMKYMGDINYKSDDISMNYTDMWGHNSYTGYTFGSYFDYYKMISAKPLVMTEFGIDSYNNTGAKEYQNIQAAWLAHQFSEIKSNSAGGTVMEYSDEWCKYSTGSNLVHDTGGYSTDTHPDGYANEEYWGITSITDNGVSPDIITPRKAYYNLQKEFLKDSFAKVNGTRFMLNGKPFYFSGANSYFAWRGNWDCNSYDHNQGCAKKVLDSAVALNLSVIRTWGFSDGSDTWGTLQSSLGVYNEAGFQKMDRFIKEARDRDLKVILPLINNWNAYGGMCKYLEWCGVTSCTETNSVHDQFYTNSCAKNAYKNYISYFLNRTNTLTGIKYMNDPTIFAWELANEPRCRSDTSGATLNNWIGEMSAYIKSLDPNHLVTTGVDGGYQNKGSDPFAWWYKGNEGQDFYANHQWSTIDFSTFHFYQSMDSSLNPTNWMQEHISDSHNIINKPVVFEEFNNLSNKAAVLSDWYNKMETYGVDGDLVWMLSDIYKPGNDGYHITCPEDGTVCTIILDHSNYMSSLKNICSSDADCNYIDRDYCFGDLIKHDEGRCTGSRCTRETTTTTDCNTQDLTYCSSSLIKKDDYVCSNAACSKSSTSTITDCDDGLFCNGQETCSAASCVTGTAVDCSSNNIISIATCNNDPDLNMFTWDYFSGFTSTCDEVENACTTSSLSITHTCSKSSCSAQCELNSDCTDNSCSTNYNDYCNDRKLVEYNTNRILDSTTKIDSCSNTCSSSCSCTNCTVDCSAPLTNEYCVKGVCGAECSINSDCDDENPRTTDSCLSDCTCYYQDRGECDSAADCGVDSGLYDYYCNSNEVWQTYRTYSCANPGTASSTCSFTDSPQLVESCTDVCESGMCFNVVCYSNSDCGTDSWLNNNYCDTTDVWDTYREYSCNNPGTSYSACSHSDTAQIKETCPDICSNGVCIDAECYMDSDCNPTDCDSFDRCVGLDYYDYDDVANACISGLCQANSCGSATVYTNDLKCIPKPDLIVKGLKLFRPSAPKSTSSVVFKFVIENIGNVTATEVNWMLDTSIFVKYSAEPVDIEPGQEVPVFAGGVFNATGTFDISAFVDYDDSILESDESNNQQQITQVIS